ncbi:tyrosine-type DNA invertase [Citrobacter koseri]|uniref:tyrosine-type DNA invertase n=1 Tax=Citrobacter koseri TaxID=545 RepID=UPI000E07ADB6|nr:tyrosine-type DNA invertase [Citrobacter koseri]STB73319.1 fimbrial regulatory protein FimB [Citrobacter koseri]STT23498.1 type 1 fimbriae regulatory protein FimB [Citrobacter koseri]
MQKRLYLTRYEVKKIIQSTARSKHHYRDYCMIKLAYIHGLRVSELTGLKTSDIDLMSGKIYINRLKGGFSTIHPLLDAEKEAIHRWLNIREYYLKGNTPWLFVSMRGNKMTRQQFYKLLNKYGKLAKLELSVNPHMLRHGCGYDLAEQGLDTRLIQDYLGHRNIRHTVHYTAGNAARFAVAWQEAQSQKIDLFGQN